MCMINVDLSKPRTQFGECVMIDFDMSKYRAECMMIDFDIDIDSNVVNLWVILICPIPSSMWWMCIVGVPETEPVTGI